MNRSRFAAFAISALVTSASAQEAAKQLTLDDVFELAGKFRPQFTRPMAWLDGSHYLAFDRLDPAAKDGERRLVVVDADSDARTPLFDPAQLEKALAQLATVSASDAKAWSGRGGFDFSPKHDAILFNEHDDLFAWRVGSDRAARLTSDPVEEVGEGFSPDGKLVAFVSDSNLHVASVDGTFTRALTKGGDENHLMGRLDWVYQEEVYGRGTWGAYWWSPDSRSLAFLALDESEVPTIDIVDHRVASPEKVEHWRYPRAGQPNPKVRAGVVGVAGGDPVWVDLSRYADDDILVTRVGWTPSSKQVVLQVQDRVQSWLDYVVADPRTGAIQVLFRDTSGPWIEPTDAPYYTEDGERFLWLSERDGYRHLYLYSKDGVLERQLTSGPWEVDTVHGIDEKAQCVWVTCDKDDVKGAQLYRVPLDGGEMTRVTKEPGTHSITFSTDYSRYFEDFSSHDDPGFGALAKSDGTRFRELGRGSVDVLKPYGVNLPELVQVKTRDGFVMEAMLIKPPGFDPHKKYPVMSYLYGGPHAPQVADRFGVRDMLWHEMLAQKGYLIWICDNRSASGKGQMSVRGIHKNLGAQELMDQEDGLDALFAMGFADPERVGVWGWSYGGYMTTYLLTHSKKYKIGIAGAPVTDWHLYDSIYTERYMGLPQTNPEGYASSSVVKAAEHLSGKLLLIHGTIDENVHLHNTLQLANALEAADKQFDMMLYPGNRHGVSNPKQRRHLYELMTEFVTKNL